MDAPLRLDLLRELDETVAAFIATCQGISDPQSAVYDEWSVWQVVCHVTFWHESFARNTRDLACRVPPKPVKGTYTELNRRAFAEMESLALTEILQRLAAAHQTLQEHILDPGITLIPYKKGSRDYSPEEHLEIVNMHVGEHLRDIRKTFRS